MGDLTVFLAICYVVGFAVSLPLWAEGEIDSGMIILWPLALAKLILKSAFKIIFTGWGN